MYARTPLFYYSIYLLTYSDDFTSHTRLKFFAFCNVVSSLFLQTVKELEKAIVSSPLGLNPKLDGQRLIASIPPYDIQFSLSLSL